MHAIRSGNVSSVKNLSIVKTLTHEMKYLKIWLDALARDVRARQMDEQIYCGDSRSISLSNLWYLSRSTTTFEIWKPTRAQCDAFQS